MGAWNGEGSASNGWVVRVTVPASGTSFNDEDAAAELARARLMQEHRETCRQAFKGPKRPDPPQRERRPDRSRIARAAAVRRAGPR